MSHGQAMGWGSEERGQEFLLSWLREHDAGRLEQLRRMADTARAQFVGDQVQAWGAIKVSSHCDDHCVFCGLRGDRREAGRFRLKPDEILAAARRAEALGCRTVLLQSGRDPQVGHGLGEAIRRIREELGLAVALSLGERSEAELASWREAGAESYLLRFMTANPSLYRLLHGAPVMDPARRLPLLARIRQLGYRVGSGIMVGFPGQSHESIADDLEVIRRLDLDMVTVGPYIWPTEFGAWRMTPQPGDANSVQAVLKVMALARLACPGADLPVGTALGSIGDDGGPGLALCHGGNVLVVDATPAPWREEYRCYPGRRPLTPEACGGRPEALAELIARWRQGAASAADQASAGEGETASRRLRVGICMGSSCFSRGNHRTVAAVKALIAGDRLGARVVLEGHLCEGLCKCGPNVMIDGELRQNAGPDAVVEAIRNHPKIKG